MSDQDWLRLDNAAKIYPASDNDVTPAVFRVSVRLRERIRVQAMQASLDAIVARTPYYQVFLRKGFFWYFLQRHDRSLRLEPWPQTLLSQISLHRRQEQLIHVYVRGGTIAADFSHVLTDGYGAMRFLGSVVVNYLSRIGKHIDPGDHLLRPGDEIPVSEYEDAFQELYRPGVPKAPDLKPAYHVGGIPLLRGYRSTTGTMPLRSALATAKSFGGTLTEYIVSAYIQSIKAVHDEQQAHLIKPKHHLIRIEVPVNMRRLHPSQTMRNFSLFVSPGIDLRLGDWSFEEIHKRVHHEMGMQVQPQELAQQIARNVGGERSRFVQIIPRAIKDAYLGYLRRTIGDRTYSGVVSNLGRFLLPDEAAEHVEEVGFLLGANTAYKTNCSVISFADRLSVTFGSVIQNRAIERGVFRRLAADGIPVTISESGNEEM